VAEIRHGKLSITVPDDWSDRSSIVLVAPAESGLTAPQTGKPAPRYAPNVVITFVPNDGAATSARDYAAEMGRALTEGGVRHKEIASAALALGDDEAWSVTRELDADGLLIQQQTVVLLRPSFVVIATATLERSAARTRSELLGGILASLRLGR
jgi:hypothetical protein